MVILNVLGKIEKIYISKKLGLYISNLPDGGENNWNNWQDGMKDTLQIAYETEKLDASQYIGKFGSGPDNIFGTRVFEKAKSVLNNDEESKEVVLEKYIDFLSKNMICIDMDYQNSAIPFGENMYKCFEGGSCEEEPVEKILQFLGFVTGGIGTERTYLPYCIYSTSQRSDRDYRYLFSGRTNIEESILELKKWGNLLDNYLVSDKQFYQLEYLCNALFNIGIDGKNSYNYMKVYSLCALFLEKDKETELDYKLPYLMDSSIAISDREGMAELMRKIRNKIAHGDFEKANEFLDLYAQKYMDGRFLFDYFEHTRQSWVVLHISCELEEILRKLINLMLKDNDKLIELSNMKNTQPQNSNLVSYDTYIKRLLEIQRDCNREQYLAEVIMPVLKMCCLDGFKIIPIYDDRATGRKTENETDCKRRMKTICALNEDGGYVVPDYIYVEKDYSFANPKKPILMVETKNPVIISGERYRKLEEYFQTYKSELVEEIKACGCVIYTDGITWMFLELEDDKIIESKKYKTVRLVNLHEKTNKAYRFSTLLETTEWKRLISNTRLLLKDMMK